jgi:hypothetical protein
VSILYWYYIGCVMIAIGISGYVLYLDYRDPILDPPSQKYSRFSDLITWCIIGAASLPFANIITLCVIMWIYRNMLKIEIKHPVG